MPDLFEILYELARRAHIAAGFAVLALFWFQMLSRKGSPAHVLAGRLFFWLGMMVALSALFAIGHQTVRAHAAGTTLAGAPGEYLFPAILAVIAILVVVMLTQGRTAARRARDPERPAAAQAALRLVLSAGATAAFIAYVAAFRPEPIVLPLLVAALGIKISLEQLSHLRALRSPLRREDWIAEHLGGMFGAGISFHVAFAIFGARGYAELYGLPVIYTYVIAALPILIGIPVETMMRRRLKSES